MNGQRLKEIEEIFLAAVEVQPAEREAFFKKICGADADLRREVESLLAFEDASESFLDAPPEALAAEMFAAEEKKTNLAGRQIGQYKIGNLLGRGGTGEVYLAEDVRLNRQVALKFLSLSFWSDTNTTRRFKQEAFAASALNHPNILTIYEFKAEGGACYLAAEYVEGETLRETINRNQLSIQETLNIVEQIALALAAAHKAKIIHRDIKPENIMLREDGFVKVLDFGLAKLTAKHESNEDFETLTRPDPLTRTGAIMGTSSYMSPEQVRGRTDIDARTDIWSLGIVLFEMLTGRAPFAGDTISDTIASILKTDPPPVSDFRADCPNELRQIIDKSLAKNVEDRYQQIRDFASDIKKLKNRLEFETALERANPEIEERKNVPSRSLAAAGNETQNSPSRVTDGGASIGSLLNAESSNHIVHSRKKSVGRMSVVALALFISLIGGLFAWKYVGANDVAVQPAITAPLPMATDASASKPSLQLDYSLTVQSYNDGRYKNPFKLSGEMLFGNRDRIRLNIASPQAGFLYILNESPQDERSKTTFNILFPSPTANGGNARLNAAQEIQIPEQSWFELDAKEGTELVWLVWSPKALAELESAKRFANPNDRGKIKDPALTDFIQTLLRKYQSKRGSVERDDEKRMSQITSNAELLAHVIKLEHH